MATASKGGTNNWFFSSFSSTLNTVASNLSSAAQQILPVWSSFTQKQQSKDQLSQPTVNQSALPKSLNDVGGYIQSNPITSLAIGAALVTGLVVLVKVLR